VGYRSSASQRGFAPGLSVVAPYTVGSVAPRARLGYQWTLQALSERTEIHRSNAWFVTRIVGRRLGCSRRQLVSKEESNGILEAPDL
jgi:hypothetical protein